jgi:hypothetical protein
MLLIARTNTVAPFQSVKDALKYAYTFEKAALFEFTDRTKKVGRILRYDDYAVDILNREGEPMWFLVSSIAHVSPLYLT